MFSCVPSESNNALKAICCLLDGLFSRPVLLGAVYAKGEYFHQSLSSVYYLASFPFLHSIQSFFLKAAVVVFCSVHINR